MDLRDTQCYHTKGMGVSLCCTSSQKSTTGSSRVGDTLAEGLGLQDSCLGPRVRMCRSATLPLQAQPRPKVKTIRHMSTASYCKAVLIRLQSTGR